MQKQSNPKKTHLGRNARSTVERRKIFDNFLKYFDGKGWFNSRELYANLLTINKNTCFFHSFARYLGAHYKQYGFIRKKETTGRSGWIYSKIQELNND